MAADETPRRRTGGRSARVRRAVLDAAVELLIKDGVAATTVPAIAARAGVHATSIYRRWGDRSGVLLDALLDASGAMTPAPRSGDLRADLIAALAHVQQMLASPLGPAMLEIVLAQSGDTSAAELTRMYWARRLKDVGAIVEEAIVRGELPLGTDPEFTCQLLTGPLHAEALFNRGNPDPALPDRTVDSVLYGIARATRRSARERSARTA